MFFNEITYNHSNKRIENWMLFFIKMGEFLYEYKKKYKNFNIYINLPDNLLSSYFILHGMVNYDMKEEVSDKVVIDRFTKLEKGSIIFYLDNNQWKRCSVYGVIENFTDSSPRHLKIANNKGVIEYIPYQKWETNVIVTNRKEKEILNARVIKNVEENNGPLTDIYSAHELNRKEMLGIPIAYIIGNRTEFNKHLNFLSFKYRNIQFYHGDILKDGSEGTYCNIQWIKKSNVNSITLHDNALLLIIGAAKAIPTLEEFNDRCKIILDNQFENVDTSEMLRDVIEQDIILNKKKITTSEFVKQLKAAQIEIPKGIGFIVWK